MQSVSAQVSRDATIPMMKTLAFVFEVSRHWRASLRKMGILRHGGSDVVPSRHVYEPRQEPVPGIGMLHTAVRSRETCFFIKVKIPLHTILFPNQDSVHFNTTKCSSNRWPSWRLSWVSRMPKMPQPSRNLLELLAKTSSGGQMQTAPFCIPASPSSRTAPSSPLPG